MTQDSLSVGASGVCIDLTHEEIAALLDAIDVTRIEGLGQPALETAQSKLFDANHVEDDV